MLWPSTDYSPIGGAFREPSRFSPARILGRIAVLQAVFYGALAAAGAVLHVLFGHPASIFGAMFVPRLANAGLHRVLAVLSLQACAASIAGWTMGRIVARSRLCADYGSTLATVFVVLSVLLRGRPRGGGAEWLVHVLAWALVATPAVLVGRQACMRAELLPITLGRPVGPSARSESPNFVLRRVLSVLSRPLGLLKSSASPVESLPLVSLQSS